MKKNFANKEANFSWGNKWLNGFAIISSIELGMPAAGHNLQVKNTVFIIVISVVDPDWEGGTKSYYCPQQ